MITATTAVECCSWNPKIKRTQMKSPQPDDSKDTSTPIKRLSDPVKPTNGKVTLRPAAIDAASIHPSMLPPPTNHRKEGGANK
jgi:hypothetical protein